MGAEFPVYCTKYSFVAHLGVKGAKYRGGISGHSHILGAP